MYLKMWSQLCRMNIMRYVLLVVMIDRLILNFRNTGTTLSTSLESAGVKGRLTVTNLIADIKLFTMLHPIFSLLMLLLCQTNQSIQYNVIFKGKLLSFPIL